MLVSSVEKRKNFITLLMLPTFICKVNLNPFRMSHADLWNSLLCFLLFSRSAKAGYYASRYKKLGNLCYVIGALQAFIGHHNQDLRIKVGLFDEPQLRQFRYFVLIMFVMALATTVFQMFSFAWVVLQTSIVMCNKLLISKHWDAVEQCHVTTLRCGDWWHGIYRFTCFAYDCH